MGRPRGLGGVVWKGSPPPRASSRGLQFSADYWLVDWDEGGKGDGDADFSVTIDELNERLAEFPIQWYPPATSLARVGMLYGGSGKEQNLEKE